MAPPLLLCLFSLLSLFISPSSSSPTINLPLSPLPLKHSSSDPLQRLNNLVFASLTRAHRLKSPVTKTSLSSHSYGAYSISLSFGTPPQTIPLVMDTGSSLVWVPCTSRYLCSRCKFPHIDATKIPSFIPKRSSSAKLLGCKNPKCALFYGPDVDSRCRDCAPNSSNCTQTCPPYIIQYGSGSTAGLFLSESLVFPGKTVPDFLVGCSIVSTSQPAGIAGFGRGPESLPAQMGIKKFSYCLVSHRFDDAPVSSDLILNSGVGKTAGGLSYTPFRKNPNAGSPAFKNYYYLTLQKIIVGNKPVKIPYKYLVPGSDGNRGTIIDSGSTLTFMEKPVYEAVAKEFERQIGNLSRATKIEKQSGFGPCYYISGAKSVSFPELFLQFKGGAKMALPLANYFSFVGSNRVLCMTIVTDAVLGPTTAAAGGPAIILGNYQQQNFYIEYDLENEKLGFKKQVCKK